MNASGSQCRFNRRWFLRSTAGAGAALALGPLALGRDEKSGSEDTIHIALIGAGEQGYNLMNACLRIPGVRFLAVCDIWEANSLRRVSRLLRRYGHPARAYVDYEELLDKERDLDAAIIATPDFWHARHTVACLKAGLHVYCEKEMSNTLAGARRMAEAARRTGRLLQIGHQRRSNPRYIFCYERLLKRERLLGRITAVNGQWNRVARPPLGCPKKMALDEATLRQYGYQSMHQFRNWRWYKGLGGGPIVDLGSHQIDVYNWFLEARPASVLASGRTNYYDKKMHEWYDTVMAVYEYDTPHGPVSAFYQTLSANSNGGYFEKFLGHRGTLVVSERSGFTRLYPERLGEDAATWAKCLKNGNLLAPKEWLALAEKTNVTVDQLVALMVDESPPPMVKQVGCELSVKMDKLVHQPHLENFFEAIRGKAKLACPAQKGYETAVTVLRVNDAIEAGRRLRFQPDEFTV